MLNITNYHRNANQNYNEVQSPMGQNKCKVAQSCLIFCDPMDCSLPGSSVYGILQTRILEWAAILFVC